MLWKMRLQDLIACLLRILFLLFEGKKVPTEGVGMAISSLFFLMLVFNWFRCFVKTRNICKSWFVRFSPGCVVYDGERRSMGFYRASSVSSPCFWNTLLLSLCKSETNEGCFSEKQDSVSGKGAYHDPKCSSRLPGEEEILHKVRDKDLKPVNL